MGYEDKSFWEQYAEYVEESLPRHRRAVNMLLETVSGMSWDRNLLDLGCGQCREADTLLDPLKYLGLDVNPPERDDCVQKNYRADIFEAKDLILFEPDCFSSIFSSEVTGTYPQNERLYEKVFRAFPSIKWGIVSGFYYGNRPTAPKVLEAGGIVSYQSIAPLEECESEVFDETRLLVKGPSKMFGPDVIEVWKLLERKK